MEKQDGCTKTFYEKTNFIGLSKLFDLSLIYSYLYYFTAVNIM